MESTTTPRPRPSRSRARGSAPRDYPPPTPMRRTSRGGKATPRPSESPGNPRLYTDLLSIFLCLLGVLLALGLYRPGSAGWVGGFLVQFIRLWMGHVVHVAPLLFFAAGLALALDYRRATSPHLLLGVAGLLALLFGWLHLLSTHHMDTFDSTGARLARLLGRSHDAALVRAADGGAMGAVIMSLMHPLGRLGSFITLGAVGLASVLLISELTLRGIAERAHERSRILADRRRQRAAETAAEREEQEEEAEEPERRKPNLFLELGDGDAEPALEKKTRPKRETRRPGDRIRGLFSSRPEAKGESSEPGDEPAAEEPAVAETTASEEVAIVPVEVEPIAMPVEEAPERPVAKVRMPRPAARTKTAAAPATLGDYSLPPVTLLDPAAARPKRATADTEAHIAILENTLAQFRIQAQVVEIADGPSVTRYEIRLGEGIRVKKILDLADNIAMSLSAMSVRVEAPIPGKAAIGIEVPKKHASVVTLRECLESDEARDMKSKVGFVLGKDVAGNVRCADLARMPHLLVAGATNSGKSVCLNVLIASMLFRARPDELKMIMIDPKRVELTLFEGIPHLVHPVVKDVKQAAGILRWVLKEMDRRYDLFAHVMTRNIEGYNDKVAKEPEKKLPFLVVVIDELADLMMQQGPEVEQSICRLAQLARATGIHLVVATQRPSVDVITGLIKANVPSRISFAVTSQIDSRTILDTKGAENLIGRGDMLFKPVDANKPMRIQGAFLREGEVEQLVKHLKTQGRPDYVAEALSVDHGAYGHASPEEADDELFEPAARFVVTTGHASTSMIQRKFKIGYTRAARLVDMMEARGIVGALDGAKPREIMMSRDSLDQMFLTTRNSLYGGTDYEDIDDEEPEEPEALEAAGAEAPAAADPFVED